MDLFSFVFVFAFAILWCPFLAALSSPVGKWLTSWISCMLCFLVFLSFSLSPPLIFLLTGPRQYFFCGFFFHFYLYLPLPYGGVRFLQPCGHLLGNG